MDRRATTDVQKWFCKHRETGEWFKVVEYETVSTDGNKRFLCHLDNGDSTSMTDEYTPYIQLHKLEDYKEVLKKYPDGFQKPFHRLINGRIYESDLQEIVRLEQEIDRIKEKYRK